jgi:hypothetical protein
MFLSTHRKHSRILRVSATSKGAGGRELALSPPVLSACVGAPGAAGPDAAGDTTAAELGAELVGDAGAGASAPRCKYGSKSSVMLSHEKYSAAT